MASSQAVQIKSSAAPDVYGPNGQNYYSIDAAKDMSNIGIDITTKGTGPVCAPGFWSTVHWVGTLTDGRVVTNSREEHWGYPKQFTIGEHQVFKCWELAIVKLKEGDKAKISCPAHYVWGGAHITSPFSGEPIPLNSDVTFDLEVLKCGEKPYYPKEGFNQQPHTTTLQDDQCFYLRSGNEAGSGTKDFVLSTIEDGGKRVLNIEHKVEDEPEQMWFYDLKSGSLRNEAHKDLRVDASSKDGVIRLEKKSDSDGQKQFDFTLADQMVTGSGFSWTIDHTTNHVIVEPNEYRIDQKWHIEYCYGR